MEVFHFSNLRDRDANEFQNLEISIIQKYVFGKIFIKIRSVVFLVKLLTDKQTDRQTDKRR